MELLAPNSNKIESDNVKKNIEVLTDSHYPCHNNGPISAKY